MEYVHFFLVLMSLYFCFCGTIVCFPLLWSNNFLPVQVLYHGPVIFFFIFQVDFEESQIQLRFCVKPNVDAELDQS